MNTKIKFLLFTLAVTFCVVLMTTGTRVQAQAAWNCNNSYSTGNLVTYNGHTYQALVAIPAGECGWIPGSTPTVWQDNGTSGIPNPTNTPVPPTATSTPSGGGGEAPYGGTAASIPGTVQAENFDTGGEGVAYHDADAANQGGQYRTADGVDIETTGDTGGGYDVGWTATGEWLKYTVNVTSAGTYNINFRVASNAGGGSLHLEIDGNNVTGTMSVASTGGWQTWATITKSGVSFSAGSHVLRLYVDAAGFNINWFSVTSSGGGNINAYSQIEAETYNSMSGVQTETCGEGGQDVGYADNGDWIEFNSVDFGSGAASVNLRLASANSGGVIELHLDSTTGTRIASYTVTSTGGWQTWTTVNIGVSGASGVHNLYITYLVSSGVANLNWFSFSTSGSSGFVVSQAQFNTWFPSPAGLYTYANFITALSSYPSVAQSGNSTNDKIEAAAFFAHVAHETSYLRYTDEQNYTPGYYQLCGTYTCVAGQDYHGRGPLQLSWNYNYSMASDGMYYATPGGWVSRMTPTVGADILHNANLVSTDGVITWKTALWFWLNHGKDWDPAKSTPHDHISSGGTGFGATINDINGGIECNQPSGSYAYTEMMDRVNIYNTFLSNLGVSDSRTKTC